MSFLFVDRIDALDADAARGQLDLAPGTRVVPPWLMIEAIGQLAGWIAMQRTDFRSRPVAALVADARLGDAADGASAVGPVTLAAHIERFDGRAVLYSGTAHCAAGLIAELRRSVGPLLPLELFDDPEVMRRRLAELRAGTAPPRADTVLPRGMLSGVEPLAGGGRRARLEVPVAAPYFADHFPRRAVYPASLLADAQSQLGLAVAATAVGVDSARLRVAALRNFKVRAFSEPGQVLTLHAEPDGVRDGVAAVHISAEVSGKRIASGALDYRARPVP
jgi:3-hydroxymyristoyl/3-hydroxydecanoyl-(acyl carrier protein) dehydratase